MHNNSPKGEDFLQKIKQNTQLGVVSRSYIKLTKYFNDTMNSSGVCRYKSNG